MLRNLHPTGKFFLLHLLHSNSLLNYTCKFAIHSEPNCLILCNLKMMSLQTFYIKLTIYIKKLSSFLPTSNIMLLYSLVFYDGYILSYIFSLMIFIQQRQRAKTISCLCLTWDVNEVK
jgi:hypothetical protein